MKQINIPLTNLNQARTKSYVSEYDLFDEK